MIKNISFWFGFLLYICQGINAQNLDIYDFDDKKVSTDTVYHEGNTNDNLVEMGLKITNKGSSAINVKVKKEEISIIEGSENYFCWKECYTPDVFVSPDFMTIDAGATNDRSFKGDYKPNQNNGASKIRYTFFNVDDEADTVTVLVVFDITTPTAINKLENNISSVSQAYPVPAIEFVTIKYNLEKATDVKLEIYNLQAKKIDIKPIKNEKGELILSSEQYKPGIYFYQFTQNGQVLDFGKIIFQ